MVAISPQGDRFDCLAVAPTTSGRATGQRRRAVR